MARIKLSGAARADLQRLYEFLAQFDLEVADRGNTAIIEALEYIQEHPISGSPLEGRQGVRKFIVTFGASGYLIFHKRYETTDTNLIARIIHQKEWYDSSAINAAALIPTGDIGSNYLAKSASASIRNVMPIA